MHIPNFNVGDVVKYNTRRGLLYRMRITHVESRMNSNGPCFYYSGEIRCMIRNKQTGRLETFSYPRGRAFRVEESMLSAIDLE